MEILAIRAQSLYGELMQLILCVIFMAVALAMLLVIWFKKDAVVEYGRLFGLSGIMQLDAFTDMASSDPQMTYPKFLVTYWPNFLTRLISCPICLSVWLSGFANILLFPALLVVYGVIVIMLYPVLTLMTAYVSLYLYFKLVKLME